MCGYSKKYRTKIIFVGVSKLSKSEQETHRRQKISSKSRCSDEKVNNYCNRQGLGVEIKYFIFADCRENGEISDREEDPYRARYEVCGKTNTDGSGIVR